MNPHVLLFALGAVAGLVATADATPHDTGKPAAGVHAFTVRTNDGHAKSLAAYRGKTLLIVNTASECGNTPQYAGLEKLYEKYKDRGFVVLAFPSNDFGKQEPGTDAEIHTFCTTKYGTTFPLFSKIDVKGAHMAPLYHYLTTKSGFPGDIDWNFAKFLVAPDGHVIARFKASTEPESDDVVAAIEKALPAAHD